MLLPCLRNAYRSIDEILALRAVITRLEAVTDALKAPSASTVAGSGDSNSRLSQVVQRLEAVSGAVSGSSAPSASAAKTPVAEGELHPSVAAFEEVVKPVEIFCLMVSKDPQHSAV